MTVLIGSCETSTLAEQVKQTKHPKDIEITPASRELAQR